ncbi:MAG: Gfo/Idh/MocA family oxidoreductase [Oscillospiraceae bacterium]|nr:Gfo/Idh/MocA family oxidoreductase [Oscillospiraceae bacterium]
MSGKHTFVILGMGSRGKNAYGAELARMPDRAQITAVADPDPERLSIGGEAFGVRPGMRFSSAEELLAQPRLAEVACVCTQDRQHVPQAIAAMRKGYDVLLEKPISPSLSELQDVVRVARQTGRRVVVCHVLRYTPFFRTVKRVIDEGRLGQIVNIEALENVVYWHQAHSFVRGNWRREDETSPMILAKCCHDLDYLIWLCGSRVERVSSFGSLFHFRPENAPAGSALRCLDGCAAKEACPYDAEKIYLTNEGTGVCRGQVGWPVDVLSEHPTRETILDAIRTGPYGRCVYRCDNDVVDNQVVNLQMESGAALTLTMSAFTSVGGRSIRILGTMGDLRAELRDETIRVCEFGKQPEMLPLDGLGAKDGHAGGDRGLIETFLDYLDGKDVGDSVTTLEASVESHLAALAAEQSRLQGGMPVELGPMRG